MKTMRQDAWSAEDDAKLASVVLRHIREGSTQLAAFEESGELLGRTSAACGYRWNACVRKLHLAAIDLAKLERKEHREEKGKGSGPEDDAPVAADGSTVTWNAVFRFLKQFRHEFGVLQASVRQLEREAEQKRQAGERLRTDKQDLLQKLNHLSEEHALISEDHRTLQHIVERARRRSFADAEQSLGDERDEKEEDRQHDR